MTKRDYVAVHSAISAARGRLVPLLRPGRLVAGASMADATAHAALDSVARDLAHFCAQDNARFDLRRFYHDCGMSQQVQQ